MQDAEQDGRRQKIEEMRTFLENKANELLAYDEWLVQRMVEKFTV